MHATFLDCGICHTQRVDQAPKTGWFDLESGRRSNTPAVLRLITYLERTDLEAPDQASVINQQLIQLLRLALKEAGENTQLQAWLVHLETTNPQSKLWQHVIDDMVEGVNLHLHGEYHAKIGMDDGSNERPGPNVQQKEAVIEYLKNLDSLPPERSKTLLDEIHQGVAPTGRLCVPCHNNELPMIDFGALGYSNKRTDILQDSPIARQMQLIQEGQEFIIETHREVIIR